MEICTRVFVITYPKRKEYYLNHLPERLICCKITCVTECLQNILLFQKNLKSSNQLTPVTIVMDFDQYVDVALTLSISKRLKMHQWNVTFYEAPFSKMTGSSKVSFKLPEVFEVM